jgi:hypothetical protein
LTRFRCLSCVAFTIRVCSLLTSDLTLSQSMEFHYRASSLSYASRRSASLNDILSRVYLPSLLLKHLPHISTLLGRGSCLNPAHHRQEFASWDNPAPSPPFVGLAASIPRVRGGYGFPSSVVWIVMDALGAIFKSGTVLSFVISCDHPVT